MAPTLLDRDIREHQLYTSSCHAYTPCKSVSDSPSKRLQTAVAGDYQAWLPCAAIAPLLSLNAAHCHSCCCCCKHTITTRHCRGARAHKVHLSHGKAHLPARTGQASNELPAGRTRCGPASALCHSRHGRGRSPSAGSDRASPVLHHIHSYWLPQSSCLATAISTGGLPHRTQSGAATIGRDSCHAT